MSLLLSKRSRSGFTLVEAMAATLVTSILLVSAMQLVGGVALGRRILDDRAIASEIADGLIAEILAKTYGEASAPTTTFGRETGEVAGQKSTFDDVDDFDAYSETTLYTGRTAAKDGLVATVVVRRANLVSPMADSTTDSGLKRVQVIVKRQGRLLADRVVLKADAP